MHNLNFFLSYMLGFKGIFIVFFYWVSLLYDAPDIKTLLVDFWFFHGAL